MRHLVRWMFVGVVAVLSATHAYAQCGPITIINPPANGKVQRTPEGSIFFRWAAVTGATSYDVYFGPVGGGCTAQPRATVTANDWQPPSNEVENGAQYEWRVVANGLAQCQTPPASPCSKFMVAPCPAAPAIVAPTPQSQRAFGPVTLEWSSVANVHDYQLFIGLDNDPPSLHAVTNSTSKSISVQPGRLVTWYVVARANGCEGAQSPIATFTTTCPSAPATLSSPARGATFAAGTPVTFNWSPVAGADGYDLEVNDGTNTRVVAENLTTTTHSTALQPGSYTWAVRANFDGDCDPLYSESRTLTISQACNGGGPVELLSPARNSTASLPVTFEWTPRAGAVEYSLYVQHLDERLPRRLVETTATSYTASGLPNGIYEWWVIVEYEQCGGVESQHQLVTLTGGGSDECPASPGRATLISPAAGASNLTSPVTFEWTEVAGATGYRVLVSYNNAAPTVVGTTTSTTLTTSMPVGSGLWGVETLFGDCPVTRSEPRAFTVTSAPCSTAPVQLVSPINGETVDDSPVEFKWNAVPGAVRYAVLVSLGSETEFKLYGETDQTTLEGFVPAGTSARWMVVARFASCEPVRSAVATFNTAAGPSSCPDAELTLLTPAEGSTSTSPVRFTWNAVPGAVAYRVWASADGKAPVNVARTTTNATEVSLPAGTIVWYVEALREQCDPVVSNKARFTIAQGSACGDNLPPALSSPIGSRTTPAAVNGRVTLDWNAVERAIGYRVWVGRNGEAFSDVTLTRQTEFELDLGDGLYGWYVEALFEACNPVSSERAFFQVSGSQPACPSVAPVTIAPAQGSTVNADVTFSWTAVPGAQKYRVYVSINGSEPKVMGSTEETSLTRTLPPGSVVWTVEAVFEKCSSTFAPRVQFTVAQAQNCPSAGTTLVAPANGATVSSSPVDFTWNAVSGAVKYVLVVKVNDGAPTPLAATTDTHHLADKLPAGTIEWWVVTFFEGCNPVESAHSRFTMTQPPQNCDNRKPILLIPDSSTTSPVQFQWTRVPRAIGYRVWVAQGASRGSILATTEQPRAEAPLAPGTYEWYVEALFEGCASTQSARGEFRVTPPVACGTPEAPEARVVGQALSGTEYRVRWNRVPNAALYEIQESTSPDFANAQTFTTSETSITFTHEVTGAPVQYVYRVRAVSNCNDERGAYSDPVGVFVIPPRSNNASAEIGTESVIVQKVFLPGSTDPYTFVASADKPWLTITPSSGVLPPEGVTLTVTADASILNLGTNTGTISVQYTAASKTWSPRAEAPPVTTVPISVSLVTPVLPTGKGAPPPDALIFPAVGHAVGANDSLFESDVRVTNLTAGTMKYDLYFTPSGTDGTQTGSSSTVEIASGSTLALDDIVASLFGSGTVSSATGMLEVRPLPTSSSPAGSLFPDSVTSLIRHLDTAASSRTYNFTPNGTFGQYIPAVPYANFVGLPDIGAAAQILSLQQVAQSSAYRSNFGFAEASGNSVDMIVRVFDVAGGLLATIPVGLGPAEHRQLNGMLVANGINDLADGRVEVEVVGGEGKVTAYVSTVDNRTNDPLMVSPVIKGEITSNRYVVPGTAYVDNGFAFWVTDMRIFNAAETATPATLTFYPMVNPAGALTREITIGAGEIKVLDNVIGELFAQPNGAAGMIVITTPTETQLTATARTYNKTSNGTYGQYIPGVTPAESFGLGDRALQLLQLEHSSRFRTNIGFAETTGQPVTIEVAVTVPDLLTTPIATIPLAANEFRQISLGQFNLGTVYNARVSVKVIEGNGRVTAYGSAIDQITQDPTYVPAQ